MDDLSTSGACHDAVVQVTDPGIKIPFSGNLENSNSSSPGSISAVMCSSNNISTPTIALLIINSAILVAVLTILVLHIVDRRAGDTRGRYKEVVVDEK